MSTLREALLKQLGTLPLMTHANGYQVQALPKADLLSLLNLHSEEDIKALVETGTKLGYELGRMEAGEEIAQALEAVPAEVYSEEFFPTDGTSIDCQSARVMRFAYPAAARIARDITSQPQEAAQEPLTPSTSHSDLPEGGEGL